MNTKGKVILIGSITLVAGTLFYFLYWRVKDGVSATGASILSNYRIADSSVVAAGTGTAAAANVLGSEFVAPYQTTLIPIT